jgi:hypothetical protein
MEFRRKMKSSKNPYLAMSLGQVAKDAAHGVALARDTLSIREPEQARLLGIGIRPEQQGVVNAIRDFFGNYSAGRRRPKKNNENNEKSFKKGRNAVF